MTETNIFSRLKALSTQARELFVSVENIDQLNDFEVQFLSKKSEIGQISKNLKTCSPEEKREIGKALASFRDEFTEAFAKKKALLETEMLNKRLSEETIDVTQQFPLEKGTVHPISHVQREVERIFTSMGFEIADGPEIESEWHNFDALNIPASHPARDMQDTFWISRKSKNADENFVLRTQTSDVQIRKMKEHGAPIRLIAPGRVFRNEDVDATHDAVFYQVEGLLIDKNISLAHLKGTIETMLSQLFARETTVRLRPGYFPFVEPGFEVDFSCALCGGQGCKTCKNSGWIEFMGAGMVHPNVLRNCNIDPAEFSGFAFGFGLTRLAMMKYGIDDIRLLSSQKIEFLSQF
jgi:phenylalanyl-tRNA synthetase alpha chain